ncbi:hypothetical protein ACHAXT_008541 [Thalassiosira profunda]
MPSSAAPPSTSPSPRCTIQIIQQRQAALQQRLFSTNAVRLARAALGVEGCTSALSLIGGVAVEPNLPRGWDAGVTDDDGG